MNKPFPAYRGDGSYAFICYAHADAQTVYADLAALHDRGINVWYDEGIAVGASWRGEIAEAIRGASRFLFFISKASLKSTHCLREVDYALNHDIEIIPVYLDASRLPAELDLALGRVQALFRTGDERYMDRLLEAAQEGGKLTPWRLSGKRRRRWLSLAAALIGSSLLLYTLWARNGDQQTVPDNLAATVAPSAYNPYLDGLQLLERWDRGSNLDSAIALFREATQLDPGFALAFARLAEALRIRYGLSGDAAALDEAEAHANMALRLNPELAPVQVAAGRIHMTRGNLDLAYSLLNRALDIDPNSAIANQAMAIMYAQQGRIDDADTVYQKAISLEPENLGILDSYANFLFRQSRFEDAARLWQSLVGMAPDHFAALVNLGSALSETGRIAEAITVYQSAIDLRPTHMAYANLGTAFSRGQRYPEAVNAYNKALELNDNDWLVWGNLANVYSRMDDMGNQADATFERAIQLAESARQQSPRDPFVFSDLALYYAKTGQPELALQRLTAALALAPDSGEIQAAGAEAYELLKLRDQAVELANRALGLGFSRQRLLRNPDLAGLMADPRLQVPR